MVNQNKIFSFKIKRQAKTVFPSEVERTVVVYKQYTGELMTAFSRCPLVLLSKQANEQRKTQIRLPVHADWL